MPKKRYDGDFKTIEARALAHQQGDAGTQFIDIDIHKERAAKEYGVPVSQVTNTMRNLGKRLNYIRMYSNPLPIRSKTNVEEESQKED